jgi:hypothetical protein
VIGGVVNVAYSAPDCSQSSTAPDLPAPASDTWITGTCAPVTTSTFQLGSGIVLGLLYDCG